MMRYPIVIHKDIDSDYGVTVPDLPGCFSAGRTLDEALESVQEAIECHLEGLTMDQEPLPKPLSLEVHRQNAEYEGGIWALVSIDDISFKSPWKREVDTILRQLKLSPSEAIHLFYEQVWLHQGLPFDWKPFNPVALETPEDVNQSRRH